MANSTDEYFSVNGESLQTYAYNIETWGASRESPPPVRGGNVTIPGMPGQVFVPKVVDSRTLTFNMWVIGATTDGYAPTGSRRAEFEKNFKALRRLLYTPGREITITKRFRLPGSNTVITATGKAQFAGGLAPTMHGRARAIMTVDLFMADPFFYGSEVTIPAFNSTSQQRTIDVAGDFRTTAITVAIAGSRVNPRIAATNAYDSMWVKYTYTLGTGDKASLDIPSFTAITTPGTAAAFRSGGLITHGGDKFWLALEPGSNTIQYTSTSGAGDTIIKYKPVWF